MLIDWFTVIAEAVNFFILIWLMKRFLYKPVLNAIAQREKRIADSLSEAKATEAQAQKEKMDFTKKNQDFDQQRAELFNKATLDAQAVGKHLLDEAKNAAKDFSAKQQAAFKSAESELHQGLIRRIQEEIFSISGQVLKDLADADLGQLIVAKFVSRLLALKGKINEAEQQKIKSALHSADGKHLAEVVIRSSSDLSNDQRSSILAAIQDVFDYHPTAEVKATDADLNRVQFQTSKDIIGGVEMTVAGKKIVWSISDYLKSLAQGVAVENSRQP